jgi:DNA-directed RNA polymerase specialized sigma24 family protein
MVELVITDALAQLSAERPRGGSPLVLRVWMTAQIADDLQIAESTVTSRLHFALCAQRQRPGQVLTYHRRAVFRRPRRHVVPVDA